MSVIRALTAFALLASSLCAAARPGQDVRQLGFSSHSICEELDWRMSSMKLIKEVPIAGLFRDLKHTTKYEASGLAEVNGNLFIVFDNIRSIGVVDDRFEFRARHNLLAGDPESDSQFEGLAYMASTDTFAVIQESHNHRGKDIYKPRVVEIKFNDDYSNYTSVRGCDVDFELTHDNKGFEGTYFYDNGSGVRYLFGLCEGNNCMGGKKGRRAGHGQMVVANFTDGDDETCLWEVVKIVDLPKAVDFQDYSGIDFIGEQVGITSQEESALWVGRFDFDELEFVGDGDIYHFPRNADCDMVYCNIEGIAWLDEVRFVAVSDQAKSKQDWICAAKDQSIHIFMLPPQEDSDSMVA